MPIYSWICDCGRMEETFGPYSISRKSPVCQDCKRKMRRDYVCEKINVRLDPDWSEMNNGRGYHACQLDEQSGDRVWFRSKREYVNYLKGPHAEKVARLKGRTVQVTEN